jgi:uncharacterized membrane-anchored protein YitT (DUF2179 family)
MLGLRRGDLKDYLIIIFGMMLYAIGFTVFILPHKIVIGGMAGFSSLIFYASGETIPVAVTMYGVNIALLLVSYRMLGRQFVIRTIFGSTVLSLIIGCMEHYFTTHPPLVTDITMSIAMGSVICGFGIGLYYGHHGTAGGTDIIAAIMNKVSSVSVGRVMMVVDMSIVACSFFLPFDGDMEARVQVRTQVIIYGWMAIFIYSYLTDRFLGMGRRTIQFYILSDNWERIAYRISHETGRGVTLWDGKGYWTQQDRKVLLVWARKYDAYAIFQIVKEEDPKGYVTHSNVNSVFGNGFDVLKIKGKKQKE